MGPFMASVAVIFSVDFTGPHILVVKVLAINVGLSHLACVNGLLVNVFPNRVGHPSEPDTSVFHIE